MNRKEVLAAGIFLGILAVQILGLPDWLIGAIFGACLVYAFGTAMVVLFVGALVSAIFGGAAMLIARIFVGWESTILPGLITAGIVGALFALVAIVFMMGALSDGLEEKASAKPEK
ncbi:MAG: hypothetical protein AAB568_00715 [Patescibacteria group bacterium]